MSYKVLTYTTTKFPLHDEESLTSIMLREKERVECTLPVTIFTGL